MRKKYMILIGVLCSFVIFVGCINGQEDAGKQSKIEHQEKEDDEHTHTGDDEEKQQDDEVKQQVEIDPAYRLNNKTWDIEPIDGANEQVVLLTIDDAPEEYSLEMAKTLESLDVNAIFFVNGHFLETDEDKEKLLKIYEKGFLIGNHTYSHANLQKISEEDQREEIIKVNDMVEEVTGERPKFFRAPHGANTDFSRQLAKDEGMVLMNWTYGYDYFSPYMDKEKIIEAMISGEGPEAGVPYSLLRSGANLLMHDREWTAAALRDIVIGLQDKGYEMVDPVLIETIEAKK